MPQTRRKNMARLFNSRLNSQSKLFPIENSNGRKIHGYRTLFDIFRFIIVIGCVILFALNSYAIFRDFLDDPIIISSKVLKSDNGTSAFPMILICNESAFKQPIMATDFDGYRRNTMALDDFLIDISLLNDAGHSIIKAKPISIKHSIEELFTAFHGTCFLVKEDIRLDGEDVIFLELNAKFDLKIYLINPGDEVFVPLNIWPINPSEQLLSSKNEYIQIELKKESKVSRKNCNDSLDYVYGACIRQNLKEFFDVEQKELFMACNVPWTLSLKNISLEEAMNKENCSVATATFQSLKLIEFFYISSAALFPNCKEPCYTSTYKIHTNQFEKSNAIAKSMTEGYRQMIGIKRPNNTETYSVVINYDTLDVVVSEEIHLTTLPDFISSVGGNLGLFIGFSCLPVLLKAADYFYNFKITKTINLFGN